ncbi:hypothetical protein J8F10_22700 [Gemmata sp. G18]|uniref:Uncharacterized protein n=1 Tax=Gemmata palustris TaxID=2822762 RepID=A0ABS5BWN5_9BACT|nr:hypothetical protein [Gemmata palustris]MBP3958073.1 hypothetical protein [Gemmata palustris]
MGAVQANPGTIAPQINLVLRNQFVLSVDSVVRFEPTYIVFRGRGAAPRTRGAFFVPYDEIGYVRLERVVGSAS